MSQDFDPRRAEPGQRFGYTTSEGRQRELVADDDGIVSPKTPEDVAALDTFDLPVVRRAPKPAAKKRPAKKAAAAPVAPPSVTVDGPGPQPLHPTGSIGPAGGTD